MKLRLTTLFLLTAMLSACASEQSPQTLSQKIQGKSPEEKKEILRLACLNEAEWPIYNSSAYRNGDSKTQQRLKQRYNSEVSGMKALCRKMDALTDFQAEEKLQSKKLASMCAEKIAVKIRKENKSSADHAARIQNICEEMTGQKIVGDKK